MHIKVRIRGETVDSLIPTWLQKFSDDECIYSGKLILKDPITGIRDARTYDLLTYGPTIGAAVVMQDIFVTIPYHNVLALFIEGVKNDTGTSDTE